MTMDVAAAERCLNCEAELRGKFCSECGQRDIPPYPTVREMIEDAWDELVGWDGRLALTFRTLVRYPGALTNDSLHGKRTRYLKPLRLYLTISVAYFLIRLLVPELALFQPRSATLPGEEKININVADAEALGQLTPEQRAKLAAQIDRAPWFVKPVLTEATTDPLGFRRRMVENMPRAFFFLVPAFAGILALLFRRRRYMQHLIFALHLHAVSFLALGIAELSKFGYSFGLVAALQIAAWLAIVTYTLMALRAVYGERWLKIVPKAVGLAIGYVLIWIPAMLALVAWAVLMK